MPNTLYFGDNLDVLRRHIADESVDLVYLDPPFNSNASYNILFAEQDGERAAAQIRAFEDTWRWDRAAVATYQEVVEGGGAVSRVMQAFRTFLGDNDVLAYLAMMAPRLKELHRVLRPTGSLYLHCDPTAGHYLKMLLDATFGVLNFRNEVTWKRTHAHGSARRYGPVHDLLFFYSKTDDYLWTDPRVPHDPDYILEHFTTIDEHTGRRYQPISLTGAGVRRGESGQPWRGIDPTASGRHWALPGDVIERLGLVGATVQDKLEALDRAGRIYWPAKAGGKPRLKWFADELEGVALPDVWTDIAPIAARAKERLSYPTQKPEALLERVLRASTTEASVVLDPFCGCGTTVAVAQRLNREWIGIDITHLAITLLKHRLRDSFGDAVNFDVVGEPVELPDAVALAEHDRHQFQWWALGLVDARPSKPAKKGPDHGVDGRIYFHDGPEDEKTKQVIISVKSGNVSVPLLRELGHVVSREGAQIGVMITLKPATKAMLKEAASAGFYRPALGESKHPILQILCIEDLLNGARVDMPPWRELRTFARAPRAAARQHGARELPFAAPQLPLPRPLDVDDDDQDIE